MFPLLLFALLELLRSLLSCLSILLENLINLLPSLFSIFASFVHALTFRLYRPVAGMLLFYKKTSRVAYVAVGVGVELCKVVNHRVGSQMPYLQK